MEPLRPLWWDDRKDCLCFIDQTLLPVTYREVECRTVERLIDAIARLEVRGAPALGVAGGYGVVLATRQATARDFPDFMQHVRELSARVAATRPTAVNLSWGVEQVLASLERAETVNGARYAALAGAYAVAAGDEETCHRIGEHGAPLIPPGATVLTHCNAGALACAEWGTALGVIRSAVEGGNALSVIACETRPLLQGARLTAWELHRDGVPVRVVPDSAAAFLMEQGKIACVITGADRITRDAVFNKIGTYMHAVCAKHHGIPFYVAAPRSTLDPENLAAGVRVEERGRDEVAVLNGRTLVPDGVPVTNYAFDMTPMELVTAVITEDGVFRPPGDLSRLFAR